MLLIENTFFLSKIVTLMGCETTNLGVWELRTDFLGIRLIWNPWSVKVDAILNDSACICLCYDSCPNIFGVYKD